MSLAHLLTDSSEKYYLSIDCIEEILITYLHRYKNNKIKI